MAAYDIQKHFKALRVDTGRRRRNPFDTGFEDEIGDHARARTAPKPTAKSPDKKPATAAKPVSRSNNARDSEDEFLDTTKSTTKADRRLSPAPDTLAASFVSEGAARRPSVKKTASAANRSLTAKAQAGGILAYLDESDDDDDSALSPPSRSRHDRRPSPSPRKSSDGVSPGRRSSTPRGEKENHAQQKLAPPRHTVASPFAGTKYLQDSDDENEEAVTSRTNSQDDTHDSDLEGLGPLFHTTRTTTEIKRVDKPKAQQGGGVSWRAFSEGRADQRSAEIALLQASLRKRGNSISFCSHAVTDDGERIPLLVSTDHPSGPNNRGLKGGKRGRSPPRRASDVEPTADEAADGIERFQPYDPTHFKTNPFTGE